MFRKSIRLSGLNHDPSSKGLSDVTVQFNLFCSTLAIDALTGLAFPYHVQRLIDNEASKAINDNNSSSATKSKKKSSSSSTKKSSSSSSKQQQQPMSSAKMKPDQFKYWIDEKLATDMKKMNLMNNKNSNTTFADAVSLSSPWKYSNVASSSCSSLPYQSLRHTSWFSITPEHREQYQKQLDEKKEKREQTAKDMGTEIEPDEEYDNPLSDDELLLKLLKCKSGTPRCGRSGNFFTRQDLAYSLALSSEVNGYKSPFWITSQHPALSTSLPKKNQSPDDVLPPHLTLKDGEKPTLASASAIVFPASRLGFSGQAAESILSPEYKKVKGTKEASAMNAISGIKLGSDDQSSLETSKFSREAVEFFKSHPDFEKDGWISFDQIMKLGLPLLSPVGGPKTAGGGLVAGEEDLFDRGVFVQLLKDVEYYNQEQLEKPGKLAMRRMPGAPPTLL